MYSIKLLFFLLLSTCVIYSCAGNSSNVELPAGLISLADEALDEQNALAASATGFGSKLPVDCLQPWETLGSNGFAANTREIMTSQRGVSAINLQSDFTPGVERFTESGDVTDLGEASRLGSGLVGGGETSFAQYRILLEGAQPGAISADVNLRPRNDGSLSEYWLGLSDYGANHWEWHGPYQDGHVRLSLPSGDFLSDLGNLFVNVVACDGAVFDVIGLGVNTRLTGDEEAPPQPTGLVAAPIADGLELAWNGVIAGDLAGYRIYYRSGWFQDAQATGLQRVPFLEGNTRHLLLGQSIETFVRVAAVDVTGNESELSEIVSAMPLGGSAPALIVTTDEVSGYLGLDATLTASGAELYDWDLDGNGVFEVTGDTSGTAEVDTRHTGVIRPAVRGTSGGGTAVACGAVSLLVSGNARPVANGYANPSSGPAPLVVDFTGAGSDPDGEIVLYSWDFDGNGSYDWSDPANSNPPPKTYGLPYLRNVKFRIDDDQGAYDVDTVSVQILDPEENQPPVIELHLDRSSGDFPLYVLADASGSYDPEGGQLVFQWDLESDGDYEIEGFNSSANLIYGAPNFWLMTLRVTDDQLNSSTVSRAITCRGPVSNIVDFNNDVGLYSSLAVVSGNPAIAYYDATDTDLLFARALDIYGNEWDEPVVVHAAEFEDFGKYCSMTMINGRPAISYFHGSGDSNLMYVRSLDIYGEEWGSPITVDNGSGVGTYTCLKNVAGRPAIAYYDWVADKVCYIRADDNNGDSWTGSRVLVADVGATSESTYSMLSMATIYGRPSIAYYDMLLDRLRFVRANDIIGGSWGTFYTVDDSADVGRYPSLVDAEGYAAIAYYDVDNVRLKFARAKNHEATDWYAPVVLDPLPYTGEHTSLEIIGNCPVISYRRYELVGAELLSRLRYIRANDPWGASWSPPVELFAEGDFGEGNSLFPVRELIALSYYDGLYGSLRYTLIIE